MIHQQSHGRRQGGINRQLRQRHADQFAVLRHPAMGLADREQLPQSAAGDGQKHQALIATHRQERLRTHRRMDRAGDPSAIGAALADHGVQNRTLAGIARQVDHFGQCIVNGRHFRVFGDVQFHGFGLLAFVLKGWADRV